MPNLAPPASVVQLRSRLANAPLRTARLALRLPRADDARRVFDGYARDAEAIRWLSFPPHESVATTQAVVARWCASWERGAGKLPLVVERADDGAFVGVVGLEPGDHGVAVSHVLCRSAWGQGYATEAVRAVVDLAFEMLGSHRLWATCAVGNAAARHVLEKAGLRHEGVLRRWGVSPLVSPEPLDAYCLAITRDDWLAQRAATTDASPTGGRVRIVDETHVPATRQSIVAGLRAYNVRFVEPAEFTPLVLAARDANGHLVGGLAGETTWARTGDGWLFVDLLWVADGHRAGGVGSALLAAAEHEAWRRGCRSAYLDTFAFQARAFYERHGYALFGTLENYPPGFARHFLWKRLAPDDAAAG
jgi:RimJ/RimL family protein N-acetyltransferase